MTLRSRSTSRIPEFGIPVVLHLTKRGLNQIKAIYANMPANHRLRHRISMLDESILGGSYRHIVNLAKKLLKHEEMHGAYYLICILKCINSIHQNLLFIIFKIN